MYWINKFSRQVQHTSRSQHSFRKGICTSTSLVNFLEDMYKTPDNKAAGFFLDLTKPCDMVGPGQHSQYSDLLQAGQSRDRILVGARFSTPVQTGPGAYPASYTIGTGSLLGVKRPRVVLTTHPHLEPRLKKQQSYISTPLWAFVACSRVNFTFM